MNKVDYKNIKGIEITFDNKEESSVYIPRTQIPKIRGNYITKKYIGEVFNDDFSVEEKEIKENYLSRLEIIISKKADNRFDITPNHKSKYTLFGYLLDAYNCFNIKKIEIFYKNNETFVAYAPIEYTTGEEAQKNDSECKKYFDDNGNLRYICHRINNNRDLLYDSNEVDEDVTSPIPTNKKELEYKIDYNKLFIESVISFDKLKEKLRTLSIIDAVNDRWKKLTPEQKLLCTVFFEYEGVAKKVLGDNFDSEIKTRIKGYLGAFIIE